MHESEYAYSSIKNWRRSLNAVFLMAVKENLLRSSPFNFELKEVIPDTTQPKKALTLKQQANLLDFIRQDSVYGRYYEEGMILLNTRLRISELCGLTLADVDMDNRVIHISHRLLYNKKNGYYIEKPKTDSGMRDVPMNDAAYPAAHVLHQHGQQRYGDKDVTVYHEACKYSADHELL